jgi:phosphoribosylformylglycinamidine synthase
MSSSSSSSSKRIKGEDTGNGDASSQVLHWYRYPILDASSAARLLKRIQGSEKIEMETEYCFNIGLIGRSLSEENVRLLRWLLSETFEQEKFSTERSFVEQLSGTSNGKDKVFSYLVEVGPRLCFSTAWSTNAVSICR